MAADRFRQGSSLTEVLRRSVAGGRLNLRLHILARHFAAKMIKDLISAQRTAVAAIWVELRFPWTVQVEERLSLTSIPRGA